MEHEKKVTVDANDLYRFWCKFHYETVCGKDFHWSECQMVADWLLDAGIEILPEMNPFHPTTKQ